MVYIHQKEREREIEGEKERKRKRERKSPGKQRFQDQGALNFHDFMRENGRQK